MRFATPSIKRTCTVQEGERYVKAFPRLTHTQRLLALHQLHSLEKIDGIEPDILFRDGCLLKPSHILSTPSGTTALARTNKTKISLGSKVPVHTLYSEYEHKEQIIAQSLHTHLEPDTHTQSTSFPTSNLSYTEQKKTHLCTWIGCHETVPLFGALGVLGIRTTVNEIARLLDGTLLHIKNPSVVGIHLKGTLPPFTTSGDVAHALMNKLSAYALPYKTIEFFGEGVSALTQNMRFHINTHIQALDALAMLWPIDDVTLALLPQGHTIKKIATALGLQNVVEDRDYTHTLELDLGTITPGTTVRLATTEDIVSTTNQGEGVQLNSTSLSSHKQPTVFHYQTTTPLTPGNKPLKHVIISPKLTGVLSADLEQAARLKSLIQALHKKQLTFKIPVTFMLPHFFQAHIPSSIKENIVITTPQNSICGTHAEGVDGELYFVSDLFALIFAVLGTMPEEDLPDLSESLTLKNVWPSEMPNLPQTRKKILDKKTVLISKKLFHGARTVDLVFPPLDIKEARPLSILRHHDLMTALLSSPPDSTKENLEGYANTSVLRQTTYRTLKKHLPAYAENFFHTSTPLVLFGGTVYGRGTAWAWIDRALACMGVRAVVATYFDPTIGRALKAQGILPLTWLPPMKSANLQFTEDHTVTLQGISTLSSASPLATMILRTPTDTRFIPLAHTFFGRQNKEYET